ncbi:uncharacterized protein LOC119090993 [Pollicipes pollicipes]|uniref:uncharacterized protein LOC119090993 n=1 Tax=Pollicipes pollicipes TaxID=41117 RepID=UPI0018857378|nr:uncharacterized protein LOC119090993 [Pollicipes pollicipes]
MKMEMEMEMKIKIEIELEIEIGYVYGKQGQNRAPAWIRYRGRVEAADVENERTGPGSLDRWGRLVTFHNTRRSQGVQDMGAGATQDDIWSEKCAVLDTTVRNHDNWVRKECDEAHQAVCEHTACYSERGRQCTFPFTNPDDGIEYHNCSSLNPADIFEPWCATEVNGTGHATRLERCLPYCYFERPIVTCYDTPPRPPLQDEMPADRWRVNWTSSWDGVTDLQQHQSIIYTCPEGYHFDFNNTPEVQVTCGNWTWEEAPQLNSTCQPVRCPEELPRVASDSAYNASILAWNEEHEYLTEITFEVSHRHVTRHVFEGEPRQTEDDWQTNPSNWSQLLTVRCEASQSWSRPQLPACQPFDCAGPPPAPLLAVSSDWDNDTLTYSSSVRYWCTAGVGWGFPSDGFATERSVTCQAGRQLVADQRRGLHR